MQCCFHCSWLKLGNHSTETNVSSHVVSIVFIDVIMRFSRASNYASFVLKISAVLLMIWTIDFNALNNTNLSGHTAVTKQRHGCATCVSCDTVVD